MAGRFAHPKFRSLLADGTPNAGGHVHIYLNGTTTNVGVGSALNARGGTDVDNPLTLDSAGEGDLWLLEGAQYTIKIDTSANVQLSSTDGISTNDLSTWLASGSDVYYSAGNVYVGASSGTETLDVTGTAAVSGLLTASSGLATGGSTFTYDEGSFTITGTGFGTPPTSTAEYVLHGNAVTLTIPLINGTSNATTFTLTGLPAAIQPASNQTVFLPGVQDNSAQVQSASAVIGPSGTITLLIWDGSNHTSSGWTASGTKSTLNAAISITYSLI